MKKTKIQSLSAKTQSVSSSQAQPDYIGHRARMRQKLLSKGSHSLSDAELLEMILMTALPRRDVKPIAKKLLHHFLNLPCIIHADINELMQIKGVKESAISVIKLIEGTCQAMLRPNKAQKIVLKEWNQILDFCRFNLSYAQQEHLYLIYLDKNFRIITSDDFQKGSPSRLPIFPIEILRRSINLNATYLIMVHNHPSGEARPSKEDLEQTSNLSSYLSSNGITLFDHLIIANNQVYSFKNKTITSR